jgi:uncharacterized membrane protein
MIHVKSEKADIPPWRRLPLDLMLVLMMTVLFTAVLLATPSDFRLLRLVAALCLITFLPGYALAAALFPASQDTTGAVSAGTESPLPRGISWPKRYVVSMLMSLVLVPLIALLLGAAGLGFAWEQTTIAIAGITEVLVVVAVGRRLALPHEQRLYVPIDAWFHELRRLFSTEERLGTVLNAVFLVAVALAAAGVTYSLVVPQTNEQVTEMYLLTEDSQGELVADNFPQEVRAGETQEVVVGVGYEGDPASALQYTVVVQAQRVRSSGGELEVVERREIERFDATVGTDGQFRQRIDFGFDDAGQQYRVAFMLYEGAPPERPTLANAHREVHLMIDVGQGLANIGKPEPAVTNIGKPEPAVTNIGKPEPAI